MAVKIILLNDRTRAQKSESKQNTSHEQQTKTNQNLHCAFLRSRVMVLKVSFDFRNFSVVNFSKQHSYCLSDSQFSWPQSLRSGTDYMTASHADIQREIPQDETQSSIKTDIRPRL
ncbi:MAG: hypothetical protein KGS72_21435 [Cyanobacteria bacterium REEB67]|nr:hypothetical protein [Cyanobacteria bacterium REEB67]